MSPYSSIFNQYTPFPQYGFSNPFMGMSGLQFSPLNFGYLTQSYENSIYAPFGNLTLGTTHQTNPITALNDIINFNNPVIRTTQTTRTTRRNNPVVPRDYNTNTNLPSLKEIGYSRTKARKLAKEIGKMSTEGGFDNYCARHVKEAIQYAGLGEYQNGHAYQMPAILANNKNFKEISTKGLDLSSLPAGCILVYDRGVSGYSSQYGHTEITLGDGTAGCGGITHNIRSGARVFVPV